MMIMNDVEWPVLLYYVIYYEKLKKKVMQRTEMVSLSQMEQFMSDAPSYLKPHLSLTYMNLSIEYLRFTKL